MVTHTTNFLDITSCHSESEIARPAEAPATFAEALQAATEEPSVRSERDALNFIAGYMHRDPTNAQRVKDLLAKINARRSGTEWTAV